jgi:hypothetical protein
MKKAPIPFNEEAVEPAGSPDPDDKGFHNFLDSVNFRRKIHDPNYPTKGTGAHVPLWVAPQLAHQLIATHGRTGHVIPHQNDSL